MPIHFTKSASPPTPSRPHESAPPSEERSDPDVSVVIPCLNEAETLESVIRDAFASFKETAYRVEVIVADNGSDDGSAAIAEQAGARVVSVAERGYGAALQGGFGAAAGRIIVFADADQTYDLKEAATLVAVLERRRADMVVGSRLKGRIEPGAMPFLHRRIGTPLLTWLINRFYGGRITDCNSGFRAFYRERLSQWLASAPGMEFASELLIKALKHNARIEEWPIALRKDRRRRRPHLKTWRDGMRHLLLILAQNPLFFITAGKTLLLLSLGAILTFVGVSLKENGIKWSLPLLFLSIVLEVTGMGISGIGLAIAPPDQGRSKGGLGRIFALEEGRLFWILVLLFLSAGALTGAAFGVPFLTVLSPGIRIAGLGSMLYAALFLFSGALFLLTAHLIQRKRP